MRFRTGKQRKQFLREHGRVPLRRELLGLKRSKMWRELLQNFGRAEVIYPKGPDGSIWVIGYSDRK